MKTKPFYLTNITIELKNNLTMIIGKLKFSSVKIFLLTFLLSATSAFSQQNFDDYKSLISVGAIPADFSSMTYSKIREDIENDRTTLKGKTERVFLEGIHYSIDELLHSGMVIYGDEITNYVASIADKLLKGDATLRSQLRFYTIKSNMTNAFSTDQGIVFVTTGLISQLTSEAQLAYVLAHEISHYTEKHVVETFDWKINTSRKDQSIEKLSQYSKDKEFDADRLGLKMYHDAGYSKDEILPTFDVLMFSYLPFDEVPFPITYWNTPKMYIPETMFPKEKYPIKAEEDEDDSKSSHPNIRKRKEAVEKELKTLTNWGTQVNILGEAKFKYIRMISRFESIRNDVIDANYADAVYSIFLLEKEYPNSIYLQRMKAKAWLGIAQLKEKNILNRNLQKASDYEGEIATIHFFLRKADKIALVTLALRQVEDIRTAHPEDKEIIAIWERMVKTTTITEKFEIASFSAMTYAEAETEFNRIKLDTVKKAEPSTEGLSKYEKIKKKKNLDNPENFDSEKFYLYGISDIIKSEQFLAAYKKYKDEMDAEEQKKNDRNLLSRAERNKYDKKQEENRLRLNAPELIFVEPIVYRYNHGQINRVKSEKLGEDFSEAIQESAQELGMTVTTISSGNLKKLGTSGFNERAVLLSYLAQLSYEEDIDVFPVDYSMLDEIKTNYGTSKVMFSILEHSYEPDLSAGLVSSILFFPVALVVFPLEFLTGNQTELSVIVMDIDKGGIEAGATYFYREPLSKLSMAAHVFDVLQQVKSKPL